MTGATEADSASPDAARYEALLDTGSANPVRSKGALSIVEGECKNTRVLLAVTDRSVSGGSFGVDECELLHDWLSHCRASKTPIVLVLDSGGARLTSGLAGLAAFRRMYRAALELRLAGVPMVGFVERDCFGGASMLAMLCTVRAAMSSARIGMSGPAIIETLAGKQHLDTSDRDAVRALFGAPARARAGAVDVVVDEQTSRRDTLAHLLQLAADKQTDIRAQHQILKQRLLDAGVDAPAPRLSGALALFRRGVPVGAVELWQLADVVLAAQRAQTITLRVNCPGQAASRQDELLVLSEYVAHLALCLYIAASRGVEVITHVEGELAGGIYVALAAGVARVEATGNALVRVLPAKAVEVVLKKPPADETLADAVRTGVVDRLVAAADLRPET